MVSMAPGSGEKESVAYLGQIYIPSTVGLAAMRELPIVMQSGRDEMVTGTSPYSVLCYSPAGCDVASLTSLKRKLDLFWVALYCLKS